MSEIRFDSYYWGCTAERLEKVMLKSKGKWFRLIFGH